MDKEFRYMLVNVKKPKRMRKEPRHSNSVSKEIDFKGGEGPYGFIE